MKMKPYEREDVYFSLLLLFFFGSETYQRWIHLKYPTQVEVMTMTIAIAHFGTIH